MLARLPLLTDLRDCNISVTPRPFGLFEQYITVLLNIIGFYLAETSTSETETPVALYIMLVCPWWRVIGLSLLKSVLV